MGGDIGHTQLRIGVSGGSVEHRGEREVRVIQEEERAGDEEKQTQKKPVEKKQKKTNSPTTN